jgi:1,4-dihydroxy-2-naphthoate octaprenyltransferase
VNSTISDGIHGKAEPNNEVSSKKRSAYVAILRPPFLSASALSIVLGATIAWTSTGTFAWDLFFLTFIAGICIHAGTDAANDYFDHLSGNDDINTEFASPFTGGSRMIQMGYITPGEVIKVSLAMFTIAGIIGIYLTFLKGIMILILGGIGILSGFFYSAPPIKLASRGLGEPIVGLNFGILLALGSYYVQTQSIVLEPIITSVPISLLIIGVLWINEFPDYNADKGVGKRTLVVRIGRRKASIVYTLIIIFSYVFFPLVIIFGMASYFRLIFMSTLPLSALGIYYALNFHSEPMKIIPGNASAVIAHTLSVITLILSYIIESVFPSLFISIGVAFTIALLTFLFSIKLHRNNTSHS